MTTGLDSLVAFVALDGEEDVPLYRFWNRIRKADKREGNIFRISIVWEKSSGKVQISQSAVGEQASPVNLSQNSQFPWLHNTSEM